MRDRSLETLDLIKIVLMASVVLCHSVAFYGGGWFAPCILINDNEYLGVFSKWLGTFHSMWRDLRWYLDIYIVISVMTKVATDNSGRLQEKKQKDC